MTDEERAEKLAAANEAFADLVATAMQTAVLFGEADEHVPASLTRLIGQRTADSLASIGQQLKRLRIQTGHTLREFCQANNLDASTYSRIERGLPHLTDEELLDKLPAIPPAGNIDELVEAVRAS